MIRTTHLEIVSKGQWVRRAREGTGLDIRECVVKQPRLNRFLYEYVGGNWRWVERLVWTEQQWHDYAASDDLRTFIACRQGSIAGYYELQRQDGAGVEIRIFGLTPEFVGQSLGGPLLDSAIENAFAWDARRVWVHTCTNDHPNALANYLKSGFKVFKIEEKPETDKNPPQELELLRLLARGEKEIGAGEGYDLDAVLAEADAQSSAGVTPLRNNRTVDLIVTDLGGTLVRTDGAIMAAVWRAAEELGIPEGYADPVYDVFGTSIWEYIHAYLPEGHKDRTDACHERFWQLFPGAVLERITAFDGVEEALRDLKNRGVRVAVLSGLRIEAIEGILSTLRFTAWDAVRSSMMYPTESGDSRALGIIALVEEFGADPARTVYIGDTDHDVRQARRAGVVSAVVKTGGQAVKHLDRIQAEAPDYLLDAWPNLNGAV